MIDFKHQVIKAKAENKRYIANLLKNKRQKRNTQQERIEESRYKLLKEAAATEKITISKLLDEVIDNFFESPSNNSKLKIKR